jgi:hypothetical protein
VSDHWIGMPPACWPDGLCEMEGTGSTFRADGSEWELYECRNCGRGEDRRLSDEEDEDATW